MTHRRAVGTFTGALVAVALAIPAGASAATITNAGFESGDLTGWTVVDSGAGTWSVYTGSAAAGGLAVGAPPEGTHGATTSQNLPGSHVLYQDVALAPGSTHEQLLRCRR
jgi:predicted RNA methylase